VVAYRQVGLGSRSVHPGVRWPFRVVLCCFHGVRGFSGVRVRRPCVYRLLTWLRERCGGCVWLLSSRLWGSLVELVFAGLDVGAGSE